MVVSAPHRVFNVSEYYRMAEAGILTEDDRVELIEGQIVTMSPIGSPHAACVKRLNALLNDQLGETVIVSVQDPIRLSDYSQPQPDIALLRPRADFYASAHPIPADVLVIMEVAETSLQYDRDVKTRLYAEAGITEVWLWNLGDEIVQQYARSVNGTYQELRIARRGESLTSTVLPNLTLSVDDIFG